MAKKLVSVRIKDETDLLLKKLSVVKEETQAAVMDEAIKNLARKEKVTL